MPQAIPLSRDIEDFRVGSLTYNGVAFPSARKMKGQYEPVMDDAGRITKYVKGSISVSCYLFPGCLATNSAVIDGRDALNYYQAPSVGATASGSLDYTTDSSLATLRQRLTEPCQKLEIIYQGFGSITLNDPFGYVRDVNNGPKPKVTKWTPYTNKMAYVEWEIEFCYSPCQATIGTFANSEGICQWPFEVEITVDDKGLTTRVISGKVEYARTRNPTITSQAGVSQQFNMLKMEQQILSMFPRLKGFKRTNQSFHLSSDRKYIEFSIQDHEINSPEPYGIGIAHEEVTLNTSSSFGKEGGFFSRWMTSLEGTIHLYPDYDKSFAYAEAAALFDRYCKSVCNLGRKPEGDIDTDYNPKNIPTPLRDKSRAILRQIKYTDHIFDRSIGFAFTWELFVRPEDLFLATGLFMPVFNNNRDRDDASKRWLLSGSSSLDFGGYQQLNFTEQRDIVVNLCTPIALPTINPPNYEYPASHPYRAPKVPLTGQGKTGNTKQYQLTGDNNPYYSTYNFRVGVSSLLKQIPHIPLLSHPLIKEVAPNYQEMFKNEEAKTPVTPAPYSDASGYDLPENRRKAIIHKYGPTTTVLTAVGYAERLGQIPQIPMIESMDGMPAVPVGAVEFLPLHLGYGIDVSSGNNYSVHGLAWRKQYVVVGEPSKYHLKSSGHNPAFSV